MADFSRRGMLKMIAAAAPAVVAGKFGISLEMAKDVQKELQKDLNRTLVAMPGETYLDKQSIWYSVADVAHVWAEELHRQNPDLSRAHIEHTCKKMARAIDFDMAENHIGADTKVLIEIPKLTRRGGWDNRFELRAGVEKTKHLWTERTRVGFIGGGIITGEEVDKARRSLFGLS